MNKQDRADFVKLGNMVISVQDIQQIEVIFRPVEDQARYETNESLTNLDKWCESKARANSCMPEHEIAIELRIRGHGHAVVSYRYLTAAELQTARDAIYESMKQYSRIVDLSQGGENRG